MFAGVSGASGSAGATGVHCQLATCLPCSLLPELQPTRLVTVQARPAQLAVQDLLAPTVQQVGTFQVSQKYPPQDKLKSTMKGELFAGVSGASGSAGATGVHCQFATSLPCSLLPNLHLSVIIQSYINPVGVFQARPEQVAVRDLLAPMVQQVGTNSFATKYSHETLTNLKRCLACRRVRRKWQCRRHRCVLPTYRELAMQPHA